MKFSDIPRDPSDRTLRQFAVMWIIFFGGLAASRFLRHPDSQGVLVLLIIAIAGSPGLLRPQMLKSIFVTWMVVVFPIGWLISHICLAVIYFGLFTPLGWILRITGHDPLRLRKPQTDSYWEEKKPQKDPRRYLRQF